MSGNVMKVAVMGAGAVGSYYGGMLARAGHSAMLIARAAHVAAIQRDGLRMETQSFDTRVPVQASSDPSAVRGAKLILCCVKATDTEHAAQEMAPHLDEDALILSLQNGVDNAERLQAALGRRVSPAVVYVATDLAGPGHVRHHGRGELVVGPDALPDGFERQFCDAGIPILRSDNVRGTLWAKLILNCAWNALSAITDLPYGRLFTSPGIESTMRHIVEECLAVARADGITLPGDPWENVVQIARTMPAQRSSTAQDLARGKRSEIDHLNGFIMRRGEALKIPTPVNRVLHTVVRTIELRDAERSTRQ